MSVFVEPMERWKHVGRNKGKENYRLLGRAKVCGCPMHVEAIRVTERDDGQQVAADPDHELAFTELFMLCGEGPFRTVEFEGGRYVVFFTPYQQ